MKPPAAESSTGLRTLRLSVPIGGLTALLSVLSSITVQRRFLNLSLYVLTQIREVDSQKQDFWVSGSVKLSVTMQQITNPEARNDDSLC